MNHLTVEEIIDFISMDKLNEETLELAATVNGHITKCQECFENVKAFQILRDEFLRLNSDVEFKEKFAKEMRRKESAKNLYSEISGIDKDADLKDCELAD